MKIYFSEQAAKAVLKARAWWHENREKAPGLFDAELKDVLAVLRVAPDAGLRFRKTRIKGVRRILMQKTRHVYYQHHEASETIFILTVHGAQKKRSPNLRPPEI